MANKENSKVYWLGPMLDYSGYGYMNRQYITNLVKNKWNVKTAFVKTPVEITEEEHEFLKSLHVKDGEILIGGPRIDRKIRIIGHLPLRNVPRDMYNIIYTMIETEQIKQEFVDTCNAYYDCCFTPSDYYKNKFIERGFRGDIHTMPIGIDEVYFNRELSGEFNPKFKVFAKHIAPEKPEGFKFLSVFRWNFRKGPDCLIKSFLKEFKKSDNVSLVLFSKNMVHRSDKQFVNYISNEINRLINKYGDSNSAPIYLCEDTIPMEKMPDMYAMGDVFSLISRGEGLGIPYLEASAMGLPIIATNITAMTDYCNQENSYLINPDKYEMYDNMTEWYKGDVFIREYSGEKFPILGDSVVEEVASTMRYVFNNMEEAKIKNEKMISLLNEKYRWEKCFEKIDNVLRSI